jgi:hypothetical protein
MAQADAAGIFLARRGEQQAAFEAYTRNRRFACMPRRQPAGAAY